MSKILGKISRRKFVLTALLATPIVLAGDAKFVEPTWLKIQRVRIGDGKAGVRFAHFSDIHHKGNRAYLQTVVETINSLKPDFACFTGDLIERKEFLPEALKILSGIQSPLFGVPGNHDYWSQASFAPIEKYFAATGGAWLMDGQQTVASGKINLLGAAGLFANNIPKPAANGAKNILLVHYPAWVKKLGDRKYDLILAGHSHGGQVRIPFYGAPVVPFNVDEYDLGLFQTPAGPLYVNPGIGYIFNYNFRFNCRPEITLFEV